MDWLNDAVQAVVPALLIALSSAAVFAVLRFVSPTVRWARQIQADGAVLATLPPGAERDLWEKRVVAQAQRLRRYRESITRVDQIWGWGGLIGTAIFIPVLYVEASLGWPSARIDGEPMVLLSFGVIAWLAVGGIRMVLGQGISDQRFDYPRVRVLRVQEERRARARYRAWYRAMKIRRAEKRRKPSRGVTAK